MFELNLLKLLKLFKNCSQLQDVIHLILIEFIFWSNVCDAEYKQNGDLAVVDFLVTLLMIDSGI
jgi:hypothetical protein